MIDREKIITYLDDMRLFADIKVHQIVSPENWGIYSDLCDFIDLIKEEIIALLTEQEAVEPRLDIDALVCGNCGHGLVHQERLGDTVLFEERHNYCPHCGRMVKWE